MGSKLIVTDICNGNIVNSLFVCVPLLWWLYGFYGKFSCERMNYGEWVCLKMGVSYICIYNYIYISLPHVFPYSSYPFYIFPPKNRHTHFPYMFPKTLPVFLWEKKQNPGISWPSPPLATGTSGSAMMPNCFLENGGIRQGKMGFRFFVKETKLGFDPWKIHISTEKWGLYTGQDGFYQWGMRLKTNKFGIKWF